MTAKTPRRQGEIRQGESALIVLCIAWRDLSWLLGFLAFTTSHSVHQVWIRCANPVDAATGGLEIRKVVTTVRGTMGFASGSVSFRRFAVLGAGQPKEI